MNNMIHRHADAAKKTVYEDIPWCVNSSYLWELEYICVKEKRMFALLL